MPHHPRRRDPERRRADLMAAAAGVFASKGVERATVSDIVRAAGVAQGTFYLYFPAKSDIVDALVEETVAALLHALGDALASADTAVEKLLTVRDVFSAETADPAQSALVEFIHHPANEAAHQRMAQRLLGRFEDVMVGIVEQGVAERSFRVDDVRASALFVLYGFQGVEHAAPDPGHMRQAMAEVTTLALRALGYGGDVDDVS